MSPIFSAGTSTTVPVVAQPDPLRLTVSLPLGCFRLSVEASAESMIDRDVPVSTTNV